MTLADAEKLALTALKETMEDKITKNNVEIMVIGQETKKVQRRTPEEVSSVLEMIK